MFRSPRSRNNGRNKGIKIKHVFQISLLLGVSLWLLYQVHHSDDKKVSNITHKLRNVHSKDIYKLGRKDLRPKVNDKNSSEENQSDERGNESEDEEATHESHNDHESEEGEVMKHDEVGENEHADDREEGDEKDDGNEKNTKTNYDNEEKGREKIRTKRKGESIEDGGKKNEGTKEENGSKKNRGDGKGNKGKENIKLKSKNKDEGRKKEMKQENKERKQNDGGEQAKGKVNEDKSNEQNKVEKIEKMRPNTKSVEISSPPEGHDQSVRDEIENAKKNDKGKREIESGEEDTSPYSYSVPSFEFETANSVNDDGDSEGQDKQQVTNEKDNGLVLEEEKDALTDLGMLPESETGGSISHDDAATE